MHEGRCAVAGLGRPRGSAAAADWPVALEWMVDALQGAFAEVVASDANVHERTQALQRLGQIYGFKVPPCATFLVGRTMNFFLTTAVPHRFAAGYER